MSSDLTVLAFDTSAAHCAAALLRGDRVLASRVEDMAKGQAERLMPLLEEVLAEGGIAWSDLNRIGVGIGPGNFTGIRISVSAARGLALGLGIPSIGLSLFQTTMHLSGRTRTAVPAPRGQHYLNDPRTGAPRLAEGLPDMPFSLSTGHAPLDHVIAMARMAAKAPADSPRPAPLYVKPADAAPSSDVPPVILDDA